MIQDFDSPRARLQALQPTPNNPREKRSNLMIHHDKHLDNNAWRYNNSTSNTYVGFDLVLFEASKGVYTDRLNTPGILSTMNMEYTIKLQSCELDLLRFFLLLAVLWTSSGGTKEIDLYAARAALSIPTIFYTSKHWHLHPLLWLPLPTKQTKADFHYIHWRIMEQTMSSSFPGRNGVQRADSRGDTIAANARRTVLQVVDRAVQTRIAVTLSATEHFAPLSR